jgi:hypothetical protein
MAGQKTQKRNVCSRQKSVGYRTEKSPVACAHQRSDPRSHAGVRRIGRAELHRQVVVGNDEDKAAVAQLELYKVVLAVRIVRLVEVGERGDLMQRGCFDHVRHCRDAWQDFAAAKRRSELIVQPTSAASNTKIRPTASDLRRR